MRGGSPEQSLLFCAQRMSVVLLRHGVVPKGQESGNPKLTAQGQSEAQAAAERLKQFPVDHIYSSPERRAIETAQIWAKAVGVPMSVHPELDSWNLGAFKGKHSAAADQTVSRLLEHPAQKPPGGQGAESAHDYWSRLLPFLAPLIADEQLHGVVNHSRGLKSVESYVKAQGQGMDKASWEGPLIEPGDAVIVSRDGVKPA
jgi:broad specificity phosphatase PhoE